MTADPPQGTATDPLRHRAYADAIVERAARQLRDLLRALVDEIDPFPPFPGAMFAYGIEFEPPAGSPYGCVVLGDDAQLYEFVIGLDDEQIAGGGDNVAARNEELLKLDDELAPGDYVAFAHRAVAAAVEYLEGRQSEAAAGQE